MKRFFLLATLILVGPAFLYAKGAFSFSLISATGDSLPEVLVDHRADLIDSRLRDAAKLQFATHQLPAHLEEWESSRKALRDQIIKNSGLKVDHQLPVDMRETGSVKMEGYTVKNIYFQTLPGVYATANLYIPDGAGPFPAVVNMHGHWAEGKMSENVQALGHSLASNGYVCLAIDAFGSGERTTTHGDFEYHGANLGASLMNIGETLLGVQVADNMRAVDLLISLPYVDPDNIGATGASGGGNQTMWFAALDERVKAAVPIVSVGTFESAVMESNCVCELMPGGLAFTETAGVLALIAPRALKMCNHRQDSNPTFYPAEMLRSFQNVQPVFELYGVADHIDYELFDLTHGYWPEDREAMLGWFDLHLKGLGTGASRKEAPFELLPVDQLMVFKEGQRDPLVLGINQYSRLRGEELRKGYLSQKNIDTEKKKQELKNILQISDQPDFLKVHQFSQKDGWDRLALETTDQKLIPLLHYAPDGKADSYTILSNMTGKHGIPAEALEKLKRKGSGIVILELSGTGEASSKADTQRKDLSQFHTLSRANLWLGRTMLADWAEEIRLVSQYVEQTYHPNELIMDGTKEAGLAALFLSAIEEVSMDQLILRDVPLSYLFDTRENIDYFSMGIHLPGLLEWGDVSLAVALAGLDVDIIHPVSMSGQEVGADDLNQYKREYSKMKEKTRQSNNVVFQ